MGGGVSKYKKIAILSFNTFVFFVVLNILCSLFIRFSGINYWRYYKLINKMINLDCYLNDSLKIRVSKKDIKEIQDDYWLSNNQGGSEYEYSPEVEYVEKPFHSKHINVDTLEYDLSHRRTLPPVSKENEYKIYCLGGSTTYGSFVSDEHTWPSLLMKTLNDSLSLKTYCVNYGTPGYSPSQETAQFLQLLKLGHRPSLVIFMDGVNTGPVYDGSEFSGNIAEKFQYDENGNNVGVRLLVYLPITKLAYSLLRGSNLLHNDDTTIFPLEYFKEYNTIITNRFIQNAMIRKSIADLYGVKIIQFLQPNVFINYDLKLLSDPLKRKMNSENGRLLRTNYAQLYSALLAANAGYIDLSFLFNSYHFPALLDGVHYSPDFNGYMAAFIANYIANNNLLTVKSSLKVNPTGVAF